MLFKVSDAEEAAISFVERGGCDGGGKGILIQEECTATLSSYPQRVYGFPLGFRPENVTCYEETATTLCNGTRPGFTNGIVQTGGKNDR